MPSSLDGVRDGATIEPFDLDRLNKQMRRTYDLFSDHQWHNRKQIKNLLPNDDWASISARLRDLRKPRFGGFNVERKNLGGGLFAYRLAE